MLHARVARHVLGAARGVDGHRRAKTKRRAPTCRLVCQTRHVGTIWHRTWRPTCRRPSAKHSVSPLTQSARGCAKPRIPPPLSPAHIVSFAHIWELCTSTTVETRFCLTCFRVVLSLAHGGNHDSQRHTRS